MNYLTSLRGLAAILVVLFHAKPHFSRDNLGLAYDVIYNGFLAVDFFFVLSGFILGYTYLSTFSEVTPRQYKKFILKRIARIYPLHFFVLLLYVSIPLALVATGRSVEPERYSPEGFLAKLLLVDTWWTGYHFTWNIPSWSISIEFFAYLIFPFLAWLIYRSSYWMILILYLVSMTLVSVSFGALGFSSIGEGIGSLGLLRGVCEFTAGICIYMLVFRFKLVNAVFGMCLTWLSILLFVFLQSIDIEDYFFVPLCFSMLLCGLVSFQGRIQKVLSNAVLVYLGEISYSLYLSHFFVLDFMTKAFLENEEVASSFWLLSYVFATILFSVATYHLIEMPARRWLVRRWATA